MNVTNSTSLGVKVYQFLKINFYSESFPSSLRQKKFCLSNQLFWV